MPADTNTPNNLAKTDLVKIISAYLPLQESRKQLKGKCPFHPDTTTSLMVSAEKNIFKCFGCGRDGGPVEFIMLKEGKTRPEAVSFLAERMGMM